MLRTYEDEDGPKKALINGLKEDKEKFQRHFNKAVESQRQAIANIDEVEQMIDSLEDITL